MMTVTPFHGQVSLLTAYNPGAVGIVHVNGDGVESLLAQLTGQPDWPVSHVKLVDLGGVDHGLAARLPRDGAVLMPHGGMRVVDKLIERLIELGAVYEAQPVARRVYPEAQTDMEADMLMCLSAAASPGAVDLLLAQPVRWQRWLNRSSATADDKDDGIPPTPRQVLDRGTQLDRLIDPPRVVVTGLPNVGKSTLTNRMLGRAASLVADLPGTTRDWVGGLAQLDQVAVRWADTPGLRSDSDAVEQRAIELAAEVIGQADVLVAVRDAETCWSADDVLRHRQPDIWVMNKIDRTPSDYSGEGRQAASPLGISAKTGQGVGRLVHRVLDRLGLASLRADELWAFSDTLRSAMATGDDAALSRYVGS